VRRSRAGAAEAATLGVVAASYHFVSTWCLDAPIERVWEVLNDPGRWPEWWPGVERVERVAAGNGDGIGRVDRYTWRSRMLYRLRFCVETTRIEPPFLLAGRASGDLAGDGRFRLYDGRGTAVVYEWSVETSRTWMNALAPVARPAFVWNHDTIMRAGGCGLARRLGARLVAAD
jgi:carbon monoxide dehydrogenase subunit G